MIKQELLKNTALGHEGVSWARPGESVLKSGAKEMAWGPEWMENQDLTYLLLFSHKSADDQGFISGNLARNASKILIWKFQTVSQTWQDCIEATSQNLKCGIHWFLDNVSVMEFSIQPLSFILCSFFMGF